jgi:hypothetical protein
MKACHPLIVSVIAACSGAMILPAQVIPVYAGAEGTTPGSKLRFSNASVVGSDSGFAQPLVYTVVTNLTMTNGFYQSTNLQFHALSSKTNQGSAAIGAFAVCEVLSVAGPQGAVLSFWEQGALAPTYMFPVGGTPNPSRSRFDVSAIELGAGLPDGDAFGAIPGRRFTVNKSGEYLVSFRLHDTSKNHPTDEAPIHASSEPMTLRFVTLVDTFINRVAVTNNVATLVLKQGGLTNLFVESREEATTGEWLPVAGPFNSAPFGTNLTTLNITNASVLSQQFFRLRGVTP